MSAHLFKQTLLALAAGAAALTTLVQAAPTTAVAGAATRSSICTSG